MLDIDLNKSDSKGSGSPFKIKEEEKLYNIGGTKSKIVPKMIISNVLEVSEEDDEGQLFNQ